MGRKKIVGERGRKRQRLEPPSAAEDSDVQSRKSRIDIRICFRLCYGGGPYSGVKWLKMEILGLNLDELKEISSSSSSSCYYDGMSGSRGTLLGRIRSFTLYEPIDFKCHVTGDREYPITARCAAVGSVMYALGGDQSYIRSCFGDFLNESLGKLTTGKFRLAPPSNITDPRPVTGGKPAFTSFVGSNPRTDFEVEMSNSFDFCDFSYPSPEWKMGSRPLLCPRYHPKLVSLDGRLFAFGGNRRNSSSDTPFAEVFDPVVGYWQPLPNPPFEWVSDHELFVFPLVKINRIFLVAAFSGFQYTYDPSTWHWYRLDSCPDLSRFIYYCRRQPDESPIASVYNDTIYWVNTLGILSMYTLSMQRYQKVYVTGLRNPRFGENGHFNRKLRMALHPLSEDLLGIIWTNMNPNPPFDTGLDMVVFRLRPITDTDVSPLRSHDDEVTKEYFEEKLTTMTASVVDFFSAGIHNNAAPMLDAHPLYDTES